MLLSNAAERGEARKAALARRWEVIGEPIDDWFVEVDSDGVALNGGWEWYREEGFAVMMYCS